MGFENQVIYISGSVNYSNRSVSGAGSSASSFNFSPSIGYFITDNIALELGLTVGSRDEQTFTVTGPRVEEISSFAVNLGGNYFFTLTNKFSFIVGAALSYATIGSEVANIKGNDINAFGIEIKPGVNYFISEDFALRASVGALSYTNTKVDVTGASSVNNFGFNLNLSNINFGLIL